MSKRKPRRQSSKGQQLDLVAPAKKPFSWEAVTAARSHDEYSDDAPMPQRSVLDGVYNTSIGLALSPFVWVLTAALFSTFTKAKVHHGDVPVWMTHEFLIFGLGAGIWLVWFIICLLVWSEPRPLRVYVWGHEMMHAIWAKIFGGEIKEFEGWNRNGGYIVTDKYNFWIALVPYLYPFYSVPVLAGWGVASWFWDVWDYREWFFGMLGLTWMFHLSFTLWMMPKGQTDFSGPGRLFSVVWIYLINILLVSAFLIGLAPEVSWRDYLHECFSHTFEFYTMVAKGATWLFELI